MSLTCGATAGWAAAVMARAAAKADAHDADLGLEGLGAPEDGVVDDGEVGGAHFVVGLGGNGGGDDAEADTGESEGEAVEDGMLVALRAKPCTSRMVGGVFDADGRVEPQMDRTAEPGMAKSVKVVRSLKRRV